MAAAYLHASGHPVNATTKEVVDLVEQVAAGLVDVRHIASSKKEWSR